MQLPIAHDFRGLPLATAEHAIVRAGRDAQALIVEIDAPYYGDAAPAAPVGPLDRLWEHEVCELFIADAGEHYLEIELSPHGHHWVLELAGVRRVLRAGLSIDYRVQIVPGGSEQTAAPAGRYHGTARIPLAYLPDQACRANAYLIHGAPDARCFHAHSPTRGEVADFHCLDRFVPLRWSSLS